MKYGKARLAPGLWVGVLSVGSSCSALLLPVPDADADLCVWWLGSAFVCSYFWELCGVEGLRCLSPARTPIPPLPVSPILVAPPSLPVFNSSLGRGSQRNQVRPPLGTPGCRLQLRSTRPTTHRDRGCYARELGGNEINGDRCGLLNMPLPPSLVVLRLSDPSHNGRQCWLNHERVAGGELLRKSKCTWSMTFCPIPIEQLWLVEPAACIMEWFFFQLTKVVVMREATKQPSFHPSLTQHQPSAHSVQCLLFP